MFPIAVLVQACDANEDPLSCCISQVNKRLLKYYFLFTLVLKKKLWRKVKVNPQLAEE